MYDAIITDVAAMTNIRGRRRASAALLELEVARILALRDFALNYGKSEWQAGTQTVKSVELDSGDYKKLVICYEDGSSEDISDQVSSSNMAVSCPEIKSLTISESCGIITITSEKAIKAIKSLYKLPDSENAKWVVANHAPMLKAYLRWQLLSEIDAKSSGVAYNTYLGLLLTMSKLETV